MVSLLGFFEADEIRLQIFLVVESYSVDTLHLVSRLVSAPVRARNASQLEPIRTNRAGILDVRPTAKVNEISRLIDTDGVDFTADKVFVLQILDGRCPTALQIIQQFDFETLPHLVEASDGVFYRHLRPLESNLLAHLLPHLLLDLLQIIGRQRSVEINVVVETVLDDGTDAKLRFGVKLLNAGRHQMGQRVPYCFQIFFSHNRPFYKRSVRPTHRRATPAYCAIRLMKAGVVSPATKTEQAGEAWNGHASAWLGPSWI